jgi:hypothetical protein
MSDGEKFVLVMWWLLGCFGLFILPYLLAGAGFLPFPAIIFMGRDLFNIAMVIWVLGGFFYIWWKM